MTSYPFADIEEPPRITPAVQWLIALNVAIYFLQLTVVNPHDMFGVLAFGWGQLQQGRWWTAVTYMFVHAGFWHLALNMYTLWLFGVRLEHAWTRERRSFVRYYIACGLGGAAFHALLTREAVVVGASGAVMGVVLAYAMRWGDDEVMLFGVVPMKVKWLVVTFIGVNVMEALGGGTTTDVAAHLGGLATGWFYLRAPAGASLERLKQRIAAAPDVQEETPRAIPRSLPRTRERERDEADDVVAKSKALAARRAAQVTTRPESGKRSEELNRVLDKISEKGLESLTTAERRLLEEMSKELRQGE